MNLQEYLETNFYTRSELMRLAALSAAEFTRFQELRMMPAASYTLRGAVTCTSFFGHQADSIELQYYARGYVEWLDLLKQSKGTDAAFALFRERYRNKITELMAQGFRSSHEKVTIGLDAHIHTEWVHFLNGIYGLCTRSGLPEDIAAKELAITIINEVTSDEKSVEADPLALERLRAAVDLLDQASSAFAPHEVERSSRNRLITQMRAKYSLT